MERRKRAVKKEMDILLWNQEENFLKVVLCNLINYWTANLLKYLTSNFFSFSHATFRLKLNLRMKMSLVFIKKTGYKFNY